MYDQIMLVLLTKCVILLNWNFLLLLPVTCIFYLSCGYSAKFLYLPLMFTGNFFDWAPLEALMFPNKSASSHWSCFVSSVKLNFACS